MDPESIPDALSSGGSWNHSTILTLKNRQSMQDFQ
jgi:hypothetical protein